jgi:3-phenylpropionate/cinnamic acid dioxygenase small subunit
VLTDGDRIRSLLGRYCDLMDAGDFAGVGALFADGCLADDQGRELARGAVAVAAYCGSVARLYDGRPRTKHLVLNTQIDDPDDDGSVEVRSSYLVLQATDELALQPIITGRYVDRFAPDRHGWHFTERRFVVDLVGDLGHHLTFTPAATRGGDGESPPRPR